MIKRARLLLAFGIAVLGASICISQPAKAATLPLTVASPIENTTYGVVPINFTLGEAPSPETVRVIFDGVDADKTLTIGPASPAIGPFVFNVNPKSLTASSGGYITAMSPAGQTLPEGTYNVTIQYQNAALDPIYLVNINNVTISYALVDSDDDGITDDVENAAPNDGDANDDGVLDSTQSNVISYLNEVSSHYAVLVSSCDTISGFEVSAESPTQPDGDYAYPFGLATFETTCGSPGDTATIEQYYYGVANQEEYVARKQLASGSYITIADYQATEAMIDTQAVVKLSYDITDGSEYDLDGVENGVISDPSGAALFVGASEAENSGSNATLADSGLNSWSLSLIGITLIITGLINLKLQHINR